MIQPIFIFSLPRSGSTLLQKVLMAHDDIASVAEPWILLPLVNMTKSEGTLADYHHKTSYHAIKDLISNLPQKEDTFNQLVNKFVSEIYENLSHGKQVHYFIDKTPRYYLIIDEILKIFPDAKKIFLFRNPLQIYASYLTTWKKNRFYKMHRSYYDLYYGPGILAKAYEKHKEKSYFLKYEQFVQEPEAELKNILNYLELDYNATLLKDFIKQDLKGAMGDPTGIHKYSKVDTDSLDKWKNIFNNNVRKLVAKHFVKSIDESFFHVTDYDKEELLQKIDEIPRSYKGVIRDLLELSFTTTVFYGRLEYFFNKKYSWMKDKYLL